MGLDSVLDFAAGAGTGAIRGYESYKDRELAEKKVAQQEEIARLREEVRQAIAQLNAGTRTEVAGIAAGSREKVADTNQSGANYRHETPSGNTVLTEGGRNERFDQSQAFLYDKLFTDDETKRYQHDTPSGNVTLAESGRNRRWSLPSGNVQLQTSTTQRGQDIGAETTRRGQDIGSETTRRGQDKSVESARIRGRGRQSIFGDTSVGTEPPPAAAPPAGGTIPVTPRGGSASLYKWSDGTTRAYPEGGAGASAPAPPVTPRAARPDPAAGVQDPLTQLTMQATDLLQKFRAEKNPERKKALAAELARVRAQLVAARKQ